jgi:predicted acyl esterase
MSSPRLLVALFYALVVQLSPVWAADPTEPGGVTEKYEMIPMRDGVHLSAYLYTPPGDGPWPVLLEQRYANANDPGTRQYFSKLAKTGGYVTVLANFRGSQMSEGEWRGYRSLGWGQRKDGYDLVEWLATQPWSTGKVGTFGSSQAGFAQNFLAVTRPPHLTDQYMIDTGLSLYHEGYRIGGTTRPERFKSLDKVARVPQQNRELLAEWFAHPNYDSYWADEDCTRFFDQMNVPCFTVGSWYDFMCVGSVDSYMGRQHRGGQTSRGTQQLLLGPWLHSRFKETNKSGDLTYPENAKFAMDTHMLRWFDHYLKGVDNGVTKEPTVRYYTMGAVDEADAPGNEWRTASDWPIQSTVIPYFAHADGTLQTESPMSADATVTWLADPLHPASIPTIAFPGAKDAREFEQQGEVRTFTTAILTEPVEWTGKVQAELLVSSDAKDTDFIVRVSDVYPDGRSILIMDYVRRARYREGFDHESLLTPGVVAKVNFDVGWLSQIFNKGHRIRITMASTGAPFFEPNPNTGELLALDFPANAVVAKNTLHVNQRQASRIMAPVVSATRKP